MYAEEEFLALSGVQHFAFCRRQWALIHIEREWRENALTAMGDVMHGRAHDEALRERRGDSLVVRGLYVRSVALGLAGKCDVVEFFKDCKGHPLFGEDGLWRACPVEYKRGKSKQGDADRMQLCAQALCLEEMLSCRIHEGFLFYGATKSREHVVFDDGLREKVVRASEEMHALFARRYVPRVKRTKACRSCSLDTLCLAEASEKSVAAYIAEHMGDFDETPS